MHVPVQQIQLLIRQLSQTHYLVSVLPSLVDKQNINFLWNKKSELMLMRRATASA